eukprot:213859-Rhodomonas_salina.1
MCIRDSSLLSLPPSLPPSGPALPPSFQQCHSLPAAPTYLRSQHAATDLRGTGSLILTGAVQRRAGGEVAGSAARAAAADSGGGASHPRQRGAEARRGGSKGSASDG